MDGIPQTGVVALVEPFACVLATPIDSHAVDEPGPMSRLEADQPGQVDASGALAGDGDDRGTATAGPGTGLGRRQRLPCFVGEADPRFLVPRRCSANGQVSFTQVAIASSSRSAARRDAAGRRSRAGCRRGGTTCRPVPSPAPMSNADLRFRPHTAGPPSNAASKRCTCAGLNRQRCPPGPSTPAPRPLPCARPCARRRPTCGRPATSWPPEAVTCLRRTTRQSPSGPLHARPAPPG